MSNKSRLIYYNYTWGFGSKFNVYTYFCMNFVLFFNFFSVNSIFFSVFVFDWFWAHSPFHVFCFYIASATRNGLKILCTLYCENGNGRFSTSQFEVIGIESRIAESRKPNKKYKLFALHWGYYHSLESVETASDQTGHKRFCSLPKGCSL